MNAKRRHRRRRRRRLSSEIFLLYTKDGFRVWGTRSKLNHLRSGFGIFRGSALVRFSPLDQDVTYKEPAVGNYQKFVFFRNTGPSS